MMWKKICKPHKRKCLGYNNLKDIAFFSKSNRSYLVCIKNFSSIFCVEQVFCGGESQKIQENWWFVTGKYVVRIGNFWYTIATAIYRNTQSVPSSVVVYWQKLGLVECLEYTYSFLLQGYSKYTFNRQLLQYSIIPYLTWV